MELSGILMLLGGLALFLYGMQMMSGGLEAAAGNRMKEILEKLTSNRVKGVLVGAAITAVIQSSSATTVMVVGFVNSGLMSLTQAIWIIMGANIGTTITGQLIALDISAIAPFIAFAGVVLVVFTKREKLHHIGDIVAGLGMLFIGMDMMGGAMEPLQEVESFRQVMTQFTNPFFGILAGAAFTAVIQSSSASIGILQALAGSGMIGLSGAVYVLFGQNIGTCITAVLASIGTRVNARRTTLIHLMFNLFGTIVFTILCMTTSFVPWMERLSPGNPVAQIANVHTVFNVVTTLLLLPVGTGLGKIAVKLLPEKEEKTECRRLLYLMPIDYRKGHLVGQLSVSVSGLNREIGRMHQLVLQNVEASFDAVLKGDNSLLEQIQEREEYIDYLNAEISEYIGKMMVMEMSEKDSGIVGAYFSIIGNLERIGDHAMNVAGYADDLQKRGLELSAFAKTEVLKMKEISLKAVENIREKEGMLCSKVLAQAARLEQKIDDMNEEFRENQVNRMKEGQCRPQAGILFSEMLTDFERIGDHTLNIANQYQRM
ncbi:MAG: Na/Pi cotransporter family protein [Lachnospiraceae bacterium]|nr:Na/Pi cotransporter family protein [Lachnospiraceae bacterium]